METFVIEEPSDPASQQADRWSPIPPNRAETDLIYKVQFPSNGNRCSQPVFRSGQNLLELATAS
jgi:hypothetical protein